MKQNDQRFLELGVKFPTMVHAPGVAPWDPNQLDTWASAADADINAVHSARLLLNLWMPSRESQHGRFTVSKSLQSWDRAHRHIFLDWIASEENPN